MPEEKPMDTNEEVVEETNPDSEEQLEDLSNSDDQADNQDSGGNTEEELPENVKERTKEQFEKLKKHNEELKRQLEERKQLPSVLDFLSPSMPQVTPDVRQQYQPQVTQPQPAQPQQEEPQLVDEQGYVNADVLKRQLQMAEEARRRAEEAERRAIEAQQRISRFEQDEETKRLYNAYPELDPGSESFNREAYDLVKNELTSQIVNTGKRDAIQAAQRMEKYFRQQQPKNQEVLEQRKQVTSSGSQPRNTVNKPISQMTTAERLKAWEQRNNIS